MRLLTCFAIILVFSYVSSNVVKESVGELLDELEAIERELQGNDGSSSSMEEFVVPNIGNSHNVPDSNEEKSALSRIQKMTEELKEISRTMVELLKENNNMLKSLLPKPEPQPEQLTEVVNIANPELSGFGRVPYIMDPLILLRNANKFPEALNIHLEGEFILPENLGLRIGWAHGDTDFGNDDLPFTLHLRWNGDHYEYADDTFNRKIAADYRLGGSWGARPIADVSWPFNEYEEFSLDIIYKDGCFTTRIRSASNNAEIPMCHFPEGQGDLYFSLNSDKQYEIPIRLSKIYVSLKETIEI